MKWRDRLQWPRPRAVALDEVLASATRARNPSSLHGPGRAAKRELDRLSGLLCAHLKVDPREVDVILTGGGVAAMQIATQGQMLALGARSTAISRAVIGARPTGASVLGVWLDDRDGTVELSAADVVDATAALGRGPLSGRMEQASVVVLAGELAGGPPGIGAVVRKRGTRLAPLWGGGGQEHGVRPGSQPVALAAGWARALEEPNPMPRLKFAAGAVAQALDSGGLEIIDANAGSAGLVLVEGTPHRPWFEMGIEPVLVGPKRWRFAVDADDNDDDIETLIAAIQAG